MRKITGLRRRGLVNTVGVVFALGILCVIVVTTVFGAYYYSALVSDMYRRAESTTDFFKDYMNQNYNTYYKSCVNYANSFEDRNLLELQFIDVNGKLVASSYGVWAGASPATSEIADAMSRREICTFRNVDPDTGERIIAVSSPMIYSSGEVIGVLRYVTSTRKVDMQIAMIACIALAILAAVMLIVLISSNYYVRSIIDPVMAITEKAKRIANGSYGIQIQTHYDDEIGELAETINEMSVKISQNEKMQRDFISSLSHELRTPLTAITGWSETLLGSDSLDKQSQRGIAIIQKEATRLTEMVVELLDFTRMQDDRLTLNIREVDLRSEFEDVVFMYSSRLSQSDIVLEYLENDDDIPEVTCDPERMRQVFLNLLDNAAKHGGEGKHIDASINCGEELVEIRIRDYGSGIPEDELPLVKKKFYKGSSKARGTGIGLAVCDEIITMHGGELVLENAEGGGTLVTVILPISQ